MSQQPLVDWAVGKYGREKVKAEIESIVHEATQKSNVEQKRLNMSQDRTLARLDKLADNDMNIEYVNGGNPLIEYAMRRLIRANEFVINGSLVLGDFNTPLKIREKDVGEGNNAFGNLKNELERYYEKSSHPLMDKLGKFSAKRKAITHKLYETHIDPEEINKELKPYVQGRPITEIMNIFKEEHVKLVSDMTGKLEEYGYIVNAPADQAALEKKVLGI